MIVNLDSVADYNVLRGVDTKHPLVSILNLAETKSMPAQKFRFGLYAIYLKELDCGELKYGRNNYDFQEGTLVFIAPGQILGVQPHVTTFEPKGWALLFHPELLEGTNLLKQMEKYSFFSYDVNEALHLSEQERNIVLDCFNKIKYEVETSADEYSQMFIVDIIELLLKYCMRFYGRQFVSREKANKGILEKFEATLNNYFESENPQNLGLPTVGYCADSLHLSANYFGDLIRRETGKTAQEYIHDKLISVSKAKLLDVEVSINEIAYALGFKYPQHFTRLFKKRQGISPTEYRKEITRTGF